MNTAPLHGFKEFTGDSVGAVLFMYLSNIAYYQANKDKIQLYDKYTIFDNVKDGEKIIKKWEKEIKNNIEAMKHIEVRFLYEYPYKDKIREGATSFYFDIPNYDIVDSEGIRQDAITFKEKIIMWEQSLTAGYYKNRNIHTISIGIAPKNKILYSEDKKGKKKQRAGNAKTSTAFNYFLIDIDIEDWKKPNYEPTKQEIKEYINKFMDVLPKDTYKPYFIGFTGGGLRFIWYFNRPITKLEIPILKRIAQDLRDKTGLDIDLGIYDISRVDRILGTENKKAKYGNPRQSRILYYYPDAINYNVEGFYNRLGYDINKVLDIIEQEGTKNSDDIALETINKIKRNTTIKEFKELDKETLNKTKRIQRELHNKGLKKHNNNYGWIIDLLNYLGLGYKTVGNRIHIYSIYCDDGDNPDTAIYINSGHNAVVKDFHLNTSFNVVAYLWGAYGDKIIEYLNNNGLSYSLEDAEDTIKVIDDFFRLDTEIINIDGYITPKDIKRILETTQDKTIGIKAPTGAGKTTAIINYTTEENKKVIFLVPYYSMALQQATQNKIKGFIGLHQDHKETEDTIRKASKIIATYDHLQKIVKIKGVDTLKDYILVIDEYHNIITQYDLRYKAINRLLDYKDAFNRIIYISGTYEGLNIENNKIYEFKPSKQRQNNYIIKICKKNTGLTHLINDLKELDTSKGKYLVFINNIELIKQIDKELKREGIIPHILTASNKNTIIMENIYNEERLKENGIYLTTSVICDGINLQDEDILKIYIYGVNDIYQIGQYIARVRNAEPDIIHIVEPKTIKDMETYTNYLKSIRTVIIPIIEQINKNRLEAMEQGIKLEAQQELKRLPLYEEEKFIKFNKHTKLYQEDIYKITGAYLDRLNIRILNNPRAIKHTLLKFYPALKVAIEQIKENKEMEKTTRDTKKQLINALIKYGYDTIKEIRGHKGDDLTLMDKTGITDIMELNNIKEIARRHHKALKNIERIREYNAYGFDIEINKEVLDKIMKKYEINNIPIEKEKEIYIITANPKTIGREIKRLETAKAIILDKQGKIKADTPITIEGWDYYHLKIILEEVIKAYENNKNIDLPSLLKKLKRLPNTKDSKGNKRTKKETAIRLIKEYAKVKKISNETIKIINIDNRILTAYYKEVEKIKDYDEILREYAGKKLYEDDILELLGNNRELLNKYMEQGIILNVRYGIYLIDI